jgi:hypothetical protein
MRDVPFRGNVALKVIPFRDIGCVIEAEFNVGLANRRVRTQRENREDGEGRIGERLKRFSKRVCLSPNIYP